MTNNNDDDLPYPSIKQLHQIRGRPTFQVVSDFEVILKMGRSRHRFTIPRDTITDFASIPRALWWLFPPMGSYSVAALVHDDLYSTSSGCDRFTADAIFHMLMIKYKTPLFTRLAIYYAVRVFGWYAYRWR